MRDRAQLLVCLVSDVRAADELAVLRCAMIRAYLAHSASCAIQEWEIHLGHALDHFRETENLVIALEKVKPWKKFWHRRQR